MDREEMRRRLIDLRKRQAEAGDYPKRVTIHFKVGKDGVVRVVHPDEALSLAAAADAAKENWSIDWNAGGNDGQ